MKKLHYHLLLPLLFLVFNLSAQSDMDKIREEYEKLVRKYTRSFDMNHARELKDGETVNGEIRDFYFTNVSFPLVTLAWSSNTTNGNVLAITIRFEVIENRAFLPIATNRF